MKQIWHYCFDDIKQICQHLDTEPDDCYHGFFTGQGSNYALLCSECADQPINIDEIKLVTPTFEKLKNISDLGYIEDFLNAPAVFDKETRPSSFLPTKHYSLPFSIAAMVAYQDETWLIASLCNKLWVFDPQDGSCVFLADYLLPDEEDQGWLEHHLSLQLHLSKSSHFCAVVHDYGRYGQLINLQNNSIVLDLQNGGDEHQETVPYSACFFSNDDHEYFITRTQWNRLDIFDPLTGSCLTERAFSKEIEQPDYFHGGLYLSPQQNIVLNDGWIWDPVGWPSLINPNNWLLNNVMESDQQSGAGENLRREHWAQGACWLDDHRFILGTRSLQENRPYALLYDILSCEIHVIRGPKGSFFNDAEKLLSVDGSGLSIWNKTNWKRTGYLPEFKPQTYHHKNHTAAYYNGQELTLLKLN